MEIKSGNAKASSLNGILAKWPDIRESWKFVDGNTGISENGIITMPLYMMMFL